MIVADYRKFDVLFRPGLPTPIPGFKGELVPLAQILQAIETNDQSFPLRGYHHNQRRWRCQANTYAHSLKAFVWNQCIFTYHGFVTLFRQGGWNVPITYWEYVENDNVDVVDTAETKAATPDPPPPINHMADANVQDWESWTNGHSM